MSKKNVALFIEALTKDKSLNDKVASASPTINAWADVARQGGYEFSDEDLFVVMQKVVDDETVEAPQLVPAFLEAQSELDDSQLDQVAGGARRAAKSGHVPVSSSTVSKVAGIAGAAGAAGAWGTHVKGPFSSMPGGSRTQ